MNSFEIELNKHKNLINDYARKLSNNNPDLYEDLKQEGMIGFYLAYQRWSPSRGVTLGAFARMYVKGYQMRYMATYGSTIKLGQTIYTKIAKGLETNQARTVSIQSSPDLIGIDLSEFLNQGDIQVPDNDRMLYRALNQALDKLGITDEVKDTFWMLFGCPPYIRIHTPTEIAKKHKLHKNTIYSRILRILSKLKQDKNFIEEIKDLS